MLNNQTLQTLHSLRLTGMAEGLEQQQAQPSTHEELGFDERLALLVDREATYRSNNKVTPNCKPTRRTSIIAIHAGYRKASSPTCSAATGSTSTTMC